MRHLDGMSGVEAIGVTRGDGRPDADVVINAACPSSRLRAEQSPGWDFEERVVKTADILYQHPRTRFVQLSSISALRPTCVYGRHCLAAEALIPADQLVLRLGPMYGPGLTKGYLIDMIEGRTVYADPATRYAYAPVDWVAKRIVSMALSGTWHGTHRVMASGFVELGEVRDALGSVSDFQPSEYLPYRDDQVGGSGPPSRYVIDWMIAG